MRLIRFAFPLLAAAVLGSVGIATPAAAATGTAVSIQPIGPRVQLDPIRIEAVPVVAAQLRVALGRNASARLTATAALPSSCYRAPKLTVTRVGPSTVKVTAFALRNTTGMCTEAVRGVPVTVTVPVAIRTVLNGSGHRVPTITTLMVP